MYTHRKFLAIKEMKLCHMQDTKWIHWEDFHILEKLGHHTGVRDPIFLTAILSPSMYLLISPPNPQYDLAISVE